MENDGDDDDEGRRRATKTTVDGRRSKGDARRATTWPKHQRNLATTWGATRPQYLRDWDKLVNTAMYIAEWISTDRCMLLVHEMRLGHDLAATLSRPARDMGHTQQIPADGKAVTCSKSKCGRISHEKNKTEMMASPPPPTPQKRKKTARSTKKLSPKSYWGLPKVWRSDSRDSLKYSNIRGNPQIWPSRIRGLPQMLYFSFRKTQTCLKYFI